MYQVGDYVVAHGALAQIIEQENYCGLPIKDNWVVHYLPKNTNNSLVVASNDLRPAVLADWAKEIPEKYRAWYIVITMEKPKYVMLIAHEDSACIDMVIFENTESIKYNRQTDYIGRHIADALSAHYGIPIMPYEQYKKYMEGK